MRQSALSLFGLVCVAGTCGVVTGQPFFTAVPAGRPSAVNIMGTVVTEDGKRFRDSFTGATLIGGNISDISDNDIVMVSPVNGVWRNGSWTTPRGFLYNPCIGQPSFCNLYSDAVARKCNDDGSLIVGESFVPPQNCNTTTVRWNRAGQIDTPSSTPQADVRCSSGRGIDISADGRTLVSRFFQAGSEYVSTFNPAVGGVSIAGMTTTYAGMRADGSGIAGYGTHFGQIVNNGYFTVGGGGISFPSDQLVTAMSEDGRWFAGNRVVGSSTVAFLREPNGTISDVSEYLIMRGVTNVMGWQLREVTAISRDGSFIAGTGLTPTGATSAWRVNLCGIAQRFAAVDSVSLGERWQHTISWHAGLRTFVAFGGRDVNGTFGNQTLSWTGTAWQPVVVAAGPSARADHAMAADDDRFAYVFGGQTQAGGILGDFWRFDGSAWSEPVSTNAPVRRAGHAMAFDAARNRVMMFGGFSDVTGNNQTNSELWEFNVADGSWAQAAATGPAARFSHAMAYDPQRNFLFMFGGFNSDSQYLGDTWRWNGTTWTQLTGPGPSARFYHSMQWDASRRGILLTGGRNASGVLSDQWLLTSAGWQQLSEPFAGGGVWTHAAATSPSGEMLIAGGSSKTFAIKSDTYTSTKLAIIDQQPSEQVVFAGQAVTMTVMARGTGLAYQWLRGATPLSDQPGISGATSAMLTIDNVSAGDADMYSVIVTNCAGSVTSTAARVDVIACDSIDFNNNGVFPEDQDTVDFFSVLAGSECAGCNDVDFNNNGVFPEDQDVVDFFNVLAGGVCPS